MTRLRPIALIVPMLLAGVAAGYAQESASIGLDELRALNPSLTGAGIIIAEPEALSEPGVTDDYEVNPAYVGQSAGIFVYTGTDGTTATGVFPNSAGTEGIHADMVGDLIYGDTNAADPEGVAPGVSQVYNYDAGYFYTNIISDSVPMAARIVNQSFNLAGYATETTADQNYDNYAATYNTLFISSAGNGEGEGIDYPASSYNGIAVAAYEGASSTGPTDDGRSKPDITAPITPDEDATSFSTPLVTGGAALLLQAAQAGDAGAGTINDASDARVLKAILLNGAVKPAGWSNTPTAPLDPTYGAGILNVYNSYQNLVAGEYAASGSTSGIVGSISGVSTTPNEGWDLSSITNSFDGVSTYTNESNHYLFDLSAGTASEFTLTSTLTWFRQAGQSSINNLNLFLYDSDTGDMVALSDSTVDNVQELYLTDLAPGDYDLIVEKVGGTSINDGGSVVSASDTYALAFDFAPSAGPVPEPSAVWLLGAGLAGLGVIRRRGGVIKF